MLKQSLAAALVAMTAGAALTSPALAKGGGGDGGGGGGTKDVLPTPAIPPGTFEGIGAGPVYIHDSFGHAQRTRYARNGAIVDVVAKPEVDGIRAEYPNNATESWFGTATSGAPSWKLSMLSVADPFEPFTPLQVNELGAQNGSLILVGAEPGGPDTRPAALLPFAAPTDSAATVSADVVPFFGSTAIGFTSSPATDHNFETDGQAWFEVTNVGGATGSDTWAFHTDGLCGATLTGSFQPRTFDRIAVSYDPVSHLAEATLDGDVVASVSYTAGAIGYVGVEGSLHANVDDFTVRAGA